MGGRLLGAALQALMVALLARSLGLEAYGVFAIVSSICLSVLSLADLGMGTSVLRLAVTDDRTGVLSTIGLWRAGLSLVLISGMVVVGSIGYSVHLPLLVATALYVAGESAGDLAVGTLQGELRSARAVGLLVLRRFVAVSPFVLGVGQLQAEIALSVAGTVGLVAFAVVVLRRGTRPISLAAFVQTHTRIILTSTGRNLSNLDALVVGVSGGVQLAGLYGAAARLMMPVNIAITTLVQVTIPELATRKSQSDRLRAFRRVRPLVVVFGVGVAASAPLSPWIVEILFGPAFAEATPIVGGVLVGAGLSAVSQLYMSWFFAGELPNSVVYGAIATGIGGIILLALLGGFFGVWGCALTVVLWRGSTLVIVVAAWHRAVRELDDGSPV